MLNATSFRDAETSQASMDEDSLVEFTRCGQWYDRECVDVPFREASSQKFFCCK